MTVAGGRAVAVVVLAAAALAGCTVATPPADRSPAATATDAPADDWITYTTPDGAASWEMPGTWSVTTSTHLSGADELETTNYGIRDENGLRRVSLDTGWGGIGGPGCEVYAAVHPYAVLDSVPAANSRVVAFETIDTPEGVVAALHLIDSSPTATEACEPDWGYLRFDPQLNGLVTFAASLPLTAPVYPDDDPAAFAGLPRVSDSDEVISFASMADAKAFLATELYTTLRRILASLAVPGVGAPAAPEHGAGDTDGDYLIATDADCGIFPLDGQTLTLAGETATVTTPDGPIGGTFTPQGGAWAVDVTGESPRTGIRLNGTFAADGTFSGSGDYGGVHPNGETGWTCTVDHFVATPR